MAELFLGYPLFPGEHFSHLEHKVSVTLSILRQRSI
jgi:hypothetical protein